MITLPDVSKIEYNAAIYLIQEQASALVELRGKTTEYKFVSMRQLAQIFSIGEQDLGWNSGRLLRSGLEERGSYFISWRPPEERLLGFEAAFLREQTPRLISLKLPSLVFIGIGKQLWVYAVKGRGRPTPKTELYCFPVPDMSLDGGICWGNVSTVPEASATTFEQMELAYLTSNFNHGSNSFHQDSRSILNNLKLWEQRGFRFEGLMRSRCSTLEIAFKDLLGKGN